MEYFLSVIYTIIDVGCILIFFDAFSDRRFAGLKYWGLACLYTVSAYLVIYTCTYFFEHDVFLKIVLVLLCGLVFGRVLYKSISTIYLLLLLMLEYLLTYTISFVNLYISSLVCGVSVQVFQQQEKMTPFIISSAIYYFLEVALIVTICKVIKSKWNPKDGFKQNSAQALLYLSFPVASFAMLLILLRISSKQEISNNFIISGCWIIFIANIAILYLLNQMEQQRQNNARLLALSQQLQFQEKNIKGISSLYSSQRKQVHDFRAHLNTLTELLDNAHYNDAKEYLKSISDQHNEQVFLVNCHHAILDAIFNLKASEALKKNINIHFEVNDLSQLSFNPIDLTVLLSNLLDNAIEGCEKIHSEREIQIFASLERERFCCIVRNTSLPVRITNGEILTTKSNSNLHGYGLINVKAILNKHNGEYTMSYKNGFFQFIFELPHHQD